MFEIFDMHIFQIYLHYFFTCCIFSNSGMQAGSELSSDHLVYLISKTFMNLGKQEKSFQRCVFLEKIENRINHRFAKYTTCKKIMQINLKYMHVKDFKHNDWHCRLSFSTVIMSLFGSIIYLPLLLLKSLYISQSRIHFIKLKHFTVNLSNKRPAKIYFCNYHISLDNFCLVTWYLLRQIPRYTEFPRTYTPPMGKKRENLRIG
jgi:hypothetical protein